MINSSNFYITVNSGFSHSNPFSLRNIEGAGLWAPVVDSCQAFFKVSFNTSSPNFVRATETGSGGEPYFTWNIGPGSKMLILGPLLAGFPQVKVELGVVQTDTRTLTIFGRV